MPARIFVIGASLSGIDALSRLVEGLPEGFPAPILITQHVAAHSPGMLPYILSKAGRLRAVHPQDGEEIKAGLIYVAPPDRHMLVEQGCIRLSHGPHENLARPAIDPLFRSAALEYGAAVVGVVLTGQLDDGTSGLLAVKDRGGTAIVQEPAEATARSMPTSALRHVEVDYRCRLAAMVPIFVRLANDAPEPDRKENLALMEVENRIAEGIFDVDDWWKLERMSAPSGINCPNCSSALYEVLDTRMLRYRCRSGHAFSALSLLSGQAEARERHYSLIFGGLTEEASLAKRMLGDAVYAEDAAIRAELASRIGIVEAQGTQVCQWLHTLTGLVEPEPDSGRASGA